MTNFTKTRLTDKGLALLAKTGVSVTVTKVKTGNGEYQTDADIGAMTELKSVKQEFQITSTQKKTDTTYAIKFVMSNKELAEDYLFTEIGIYASDPDEGEILYAVCYAENKDADMIRKYSGLYEFKAIIVLNIQVNAGGVVKVVEQGLYALAEDLEELREEVGDKVDKEKGKGLSHNDFTDADKKKLDGIDEIDALLKRLRMLVPDKILAVVKFSYTTGAVTIRWYRLNKDYKAAVILKGNVDNVDAQIDGELFATVEIGNHNKYIDKLTDFPNIYYGVLQLLDVKGDKNLGDYANAIPDNSTGTFRWWVSLFVPKIAIDADAAKTSTNSEIESMSFNYEASLLGATDAVSNLMYISGGTGSDIFTSIAGTDIKSAVEDS